MLRSDQVMPGFPNKDSGPIFFTSFREQYSQVLIVQTEGTRRLILLAQKAGFRCFDLRAQHRLEGAFLPGVTFEVDHKTIYDPNRHGDRLGSLIRRDSELLIVAQCSGSHGFWHTVAIPVTVDLPEAEQSCEIGFSGWRLVVGEGDDKFELYRCEPEVEG